MFAPLFRHLANIVSGPRCLTGCLCTQWMEQAMECKSFTTFLQQCEIPPSAARRLQSQRCFLVSARDTHPGQSSPTAWVQRRGKEKPNKEDEGALSWRSVIQRPARCMTPKSRFRMRCESQSRSNHVLSWTRLEHLTRLLLPDPRLKF